VFLGVLFHAKGAKLTEGREVIVRPQRPRAYHILFVVFNYQKILPRVSSSRHKEINNDLTARGVGRVRLLRGISLNFAPFA
jgi:hypothetical protein